MNSILEKAIVHLLNEENDKARDLFHTFMVERARQIHESLRQGDAALLETYDNVGSEEYFTEADLDGIESDVDADAPEATGEDNADLDGMGMDTDAAADDLSGDLGLDDDADLGDDTDELSEIKSGIEELIAKFDEMMNGDTAEAPVDADVDADADLDADVAPEADAGETDDADDFSFDDEVKESDDLDDEEFDAITESIIAELEKVSVATGDDKEIGTGKTIPAVKTSPVPTKKADPDGAKPVKIVSKNHTGFEREPAPAVKDVKKATNSLKSADERHQKISKEGDKSSALNKDFAGSPAADKSPVAKKGSPF